jgi:hypothetical protein
MPYPWIQRISKYGYDKEYAEEQNVQCEDGICNPVEPNPVIWKIVEKY